MANFRDKAELLLMFLAWESRRLLEISLDFVRCYLQNFKSVDISLSSTEKCL